MIKEKWIEEVMQSIETLQGAEPRHDLLRKIQNRIGEKPTLTFSKSTIIRWSIAASLLIILNLSAISFYRHHSKHHADHSDHYTSNQFNTGTTYNY